MPVATNNTIPAIVNLWVPNRSSMRDDLGIFWISPRSRLGIGGQARMAMRPKSTVVVASCRVGWYLMN
jgi:hypothetical protein